jgi:hypothetical protein
VNELADLSRGALALAAAYHQQDRSARFWASERPGYAFDELDPGEVHRAFLDAPGRRWVVPCCRHCGRAHCFPAERLAVGVSWRPMQRHVLRAGRDDRGGVQHRVFWLVPTPNRRAEAFLEGRRAHFARECRVRAEGEFADSPELSEGQD